MENTYKSDYVVFIDESFNEWFSLKKEDADFCHAGIAIPTSKLYNTDNFVSALKKSILYYSGETRNDANEIKYASIRGLSEEKKQEVAKKIDYFCMKNSCYIFGFYSSLTPWLNNLLRDKYFYKYGGNIKDYAEPLMKMKNGKNIFPTVYGVHLPIQNGSICHIVLYTVRMLQPIIATRFSKR